MARRTDGEKIDELEKVVAVLVDRGDRLRTELDAFHDELTKLARSVADTKTAEAVLVRDIAELQKAQADVRKDREESSRKRWSLLPPVISAVLSGIISALVAYFVSRG
jgi:septal ring factor EnvC (AmiA/AmiB activator)